MAQLYNVPFSYQELVNTCSISVLLHRQGMIIIIRHNLQSQLGKNYYFDINLIFLTIFFEIEVNSRARETRARVKITPREKRRHAAGREKKSFFSLLAACRLFSRGVIFTRARVSLALLSLRTNGGLLVVYVFLCSGEHCFELQLITSQ